jgi:trans-aconitate methyltransferase
MTEPPENEWDAGAYDSGHSFVYEAAADLVDCLEPSPDEQVLDLGCGTGQLTWQIADSGATTVGTDSTPDMIARAREAHPDLPFVRADARALPFGRSFDAVFSNAVLHWVDADEQDNVIREVRSVLDPGGRFVTELGGTDNVARVFEGVRAALADRGVEAENPWYFPSPAAYATRLERGGFEVRSVRLFDRPIPLDGGDDGLRNWLELFGDRFFSGFTPAERDRVIEDIEARLRDDLYDDGVWTADYRRLRFVAVAEA